MNVLSKVDFISKFLLIIVPVLKMVVSQITPALRSELAEFVGALKTKAAGTENPWDDLAVELLIGLLNIDERELIQQTVVLEQGIGSEPGD